MNWLIPVLAAALAAIAGWAATWLALTILRRRQILDHPNERSSHALPTPRGGGIAVIVVMAAVWLLVPVVNGAAAARLDILALGLLLALISFVDDLRGLPIALRLAAQAIAVAIGVALLPAAGMVFQGLMPPFLDRLLAAFAWLWFVNLYNFMDGIDGIAGVETLSLGIGIMLLAGYLGGDATGLAMLGAATAGAAIGFLVWNWQPAKVFMGDVGAIGIGYLSGWLLLWLAVHGYWAAALILPLYFLADATITLLRRLSRGEPVWRAHRSHFYQWAASGGTSHSRVSTLVFLANVVLIAAALYATVSGSTLLAIAIALGTTLALLWYFSSLRDDPDHAG